MCLLKGEDGMNGVGPQEKNRYDSMTGNGGAKILHIEHWSNPDAATEITGVDYYERPRECALKLLEMYPMLDGIGVPVSNEPIPRPKLDLETGSSSNPENHTVRWGDGETSTFLHGEQYFQTEEQVFAFSPLEHADKGDWPLPGDGIPDLSSAEAIYRYLRPRFPSEWGDRAPECSCAGISFYNTMFMWPMLTFGWEMFLATCLDDRFERIMDEFAEINRRVFEAQSQLPVNFVCCHDDIVMTRGPVCSREWMNKYIFPRYVEFWEYFKRRGIRVNFMTDGNPTEFVDDIVACGASGLITEPYADFKAIAKKYPDMMLAGEGDNRILTYGTKDDIRKMVDSMTETGKMSGGYFMCVGNHIPWNVPADNIKYYFDYSDKYAYR